MVERGELGRVLSIQSHVVHGYVGNKCAVFPLQLLGFEVDPLNSNHTGYRVFKGTVLEGDGLVDLIGGLEANNLLGLYTHTLTGYMGSISFLQAVVDLVTSLKAQNPGLTYVCDPVLGDDGRCYVPEPMAVLYRTRILPLADTLTPNSFEAELLTGIKIRNESDAQRACLQLHACGPSTVVITSTSLASSNDLHVFASSKQKGTWQAAEVCKITVPRLPSSYTGTGDLTAALLLAWLHRLPGQPSTALEQATSTVQATLQRTAKLQASELQIIQSKTDIERTYSAVPLNWPSAIRGVVFDMDNTITRCAIDFGGLRRRLRIKPEDDILTSISIMEDELKRQEALAIVEEVELDGFKAVSLNAGAQELVGWLRQNRYQVALATRNNPKSVQILVDTFEWPTPAFEPIITRVVKSSKDLDQLLGVCSKWGMHPSEVLLVGDSAEDVQWGFQGGLHTCLLDIGAAHMTQSVRSGCAHLTIATLMELVDILG